MQFVLASQSPRRRQLIHLLRSSVICCAADVDEQSVTTADPADNAIDTALLKATAVAPHYDDAMVIGADTNVVFDGLILGKPRDEEDAFRTLSMLSGQQHQVHTGLAVINSDTGFTSTAVCTTMVQMRPYDEAEIRAYIATGDPVDKAGSYGIQSTTHQLVDTIIGCYLNVVGLPICELCAMLAAPQFPYHDDHGLEAMCRAHHYFAADMLSRIMRFADNE